MVLSTIAVLPALSGPIISVHWLAGNPPPKATSKDREPEVKRPGTAMSDPRTIVSGPRRLLTSRTSASASSDNPMRAAYRHCYQFVKLGGGDENSPVKERA